MTLENLISEYHANDEFAHLKDPNWQESVDPSILELMHSQNKIVNSYFEQNAHLVDEIFSEIKARIKESDETVPVKVDNYYYYSFIKEGQSYWTFARKDSLESSNFETLLDENVESIGHNFFKVDSIEISDDHKMLAYSVDTNGSEKYQIIVKDISESKIIDDAISGVFGSIEWDKSGKGFFYIPTGENWRPQYVKYHVLGTDTKDDIIIYHETDPTFWTGISRTENNDFLLITSKSGDTSEVRYVDLNVGPYEAKLIRERTEGVIYYASQHDEKFYITSNDLGKNNRIYTLDMELLNEQEIVAYSESSYITHACFFENHMVLERKEKGLCEIEVFNLNDLSSRRIEFEDSTYEAQVIYTDYMDSAIRYSYSSLSRPQTIAQVNFDDFDKDVLKVQDVPGFDQSQYECKRVWAKAKDGTEVPISLVYKTDLFKGDGSNPLYLYGYGSYGISMPQSFRGSIISLLDRGMVYATAHIRGGDELGFDWYESAKFLNKKRTFEDFISSAEYLIEQNYTSKGNITHLRR